ncbi:hypothetical protein AQ505_07040 [Pedobacter sp. PACM 27299]|uniref:hypothetical protein n=1 Tax=Pedobacter sp. PACM 27299 TaxID=1727164 RepID=UPI000705749F|nr:hypothetical protein [Pedobacter sp. PACM 27299]ALL05268.1 hypothetical protein AQ505_07040 [Pedobacter sp. PACM 27299]
MNNLNHLPSAAANANPKEENVNEQPDGHMGMSPLIENFSLSNYEDDDDDSGFSCPCCLPR